MQHPRPGAYKLLLRAFAVILGRNFSLVLDVATEEAGSFSRRASTVRFPWEQDVSHGGITKTEDVGG